MSALLTRWRRIAVTGLLAGGLAAGTALVAVPAQAAAARNLLGNGSAESVSRQVPAGWAKGGSGSNTRALTSGSGGAQSGRKYVRTKITKYRSGAAWWYSPAASVRGSATYTYSEYYRSGSRTVINAYYTVRGKVVGQRLAALPASARWKLARYTVKVPAGATKVRFGHVISSIGYLDVDNLTLASKASGTAKAATRPGSSSRATAPSTRGLVSLTFDDGWENQFTNAAPIMKAAGSMPGTFYLISSVLGSGQYMTVAEGKQLQAAGHEIGSHTVDHVNLNDADAATLTRELADSKKSLEARFGTITSLAYPYGAGDSRVQAEAAKYYKNARSTDSGLNVRSQYNKYSLKIGYVFNTTPVSKVQGWIDEAKANNTWLILCYHRIANDQPNDDYTLSVPNFQAQVNAVRSSGIKVVTVRDGMAQTG